MIHLSQQADFADDLKIYCKMIPYLQNETAEHGPHLVESGIKWDRRESLDVRAVNRNVQVEARGAQGGAGGKPGLQIRCSKF